MSTRNPSAPTGSSPIRSWDDGYAALCRRAGDTRGWIELDSKAPDRRWPRTTGLDVIVIASFIDEAIASTEAGPTIGWLLCADAVERDALSTLVDTYPGNRDFWPCLATICEYLAVGGCQLPPQAAWSGLLALVGTTPASPITSDAPPVWFAREQSLDKLHLAQRAYLAARRGVDRLAPGPGMTGGIMDVPRSTNAEVRELASFWSALLRLPKVKATPGHVTVSTKWWAVLDDIAAFTAGADPDAVYRKNNAFWRTAQMVAAHVVAVESGLERGTLATRNRPVRPIRSWSDGYAALRQRAGDTRGWIELNSDVPDRRWPRTTGLDVIVIAAFVDAAFNSTDQITYAGTALRWASCKDDIERDALHALGDTYRENRDFWSCLAMMCAHLAIVGCPLPSQRAWNALLAEIGMSLSTRNALAAQDRPPVWFANAGSLSSLYLAQRSYLANLRGSDKLAPEPEMTGGVTIVPRSTNGEVIQLAAFWSKTLDSEKAKNAHGYKTVSERWSAVLRDIDAHARRAEPNAVYPKNHAFWRAIQSVAIHVGAANKHGLTDAQVWAASVGQAMQTVAERSKALATTIAATVRDTAADAAHAAGKVIHSGARGLVGSLATPLLIGGGVITTLVLLRSRGEAARGDQR